MRYVYLCVDMGENSQRETLFRFKQFSVKNSNAAMKVGTDGVLLGAWTEIAGAKRVLDVGGGTGLVALMMAQRAPEASFTAIEIDIPAVEEARFNVEMSPWRERIDVVAADFLEYLPDENFDLIVSNPPFFSTAVKSPCRERALARHGDSLTVGTLIRHSASMLTPCGRLCFISPAEGVDDVIMEAALVGLNLSKKVMVYTKAAAVKPVRVLWEFSKVSAPCVVSELRLNSPRYRELVGEYYLNM